MDYVRDTLDNRERLEDIRKRILNTSLKIVRNYQDAEDITQETLFNAIRFSHTFDKTKNLETWITSIAVNKSRDFLRRKKTRNFTDAPNESTLEKISPSENPENTEPIEENKREKLIASLNSLPEKYQNTISLKYFSNLDYNKIASTLGIPLGTLKSRLNKAKENLLHLYQSAAA